MVELLLGIACGIALSLFFSFGPAFFSQLRTSIQYGYKRSYPFAFGVSASDVLCVFLLLTVLKNVNLFEMLHNVWVASVAGAVLLMMGIHYFRKEVTDLEGKRALHLLHRHAGHHVGSRHPKMQTGFPASTHHHSTPAEYYQQGVCLHHVRLCYLPSSVYDIVPSEPQSTRTPAVTTQQQD